MNERRLNASLGFVLLNFHACRQLSIIYCKVTTFKILPPQATVIR